MSEQDWKPGQVYAIKTVADFLAVPEHRRGVCLREFAVWLEMAEAAQTISAILPNALSATFGTEAFRWVDDDEGNVNITVEMVTKLPASEAK